MIGFVLLISAIIAYIIFNTVYIPKLKKKKEQEFKLECENKLKARRMDEIDWQLDVIAKQQEYLPIFKNYKHRLITSPQSQVIEIDSKGYAVLDDIWYHEDYKVLYTEHWDRLVVLDYKDVDFEEKHDIMDLVPVPNCAPVPMTKTIIRKTHRPAFKFDKPVKVGEWLHSGDDMEETFGLGKYERKIVEVEHYPYPVVYEKLLSQNKHYSVIGFKNPMKPVSLYKGTKKNCIKYITEYCDRELVCKTSDGVFKLYETVPRLTNHQKNNYGEINYHN